MKRYLIVSIVFLLAACAAVQGTYKQGIQGNTVWSSGNRMPSTETKLSAPEPVSRWVIITPVVAMEKMDELVDGLYPTLPVAPVDSVESDKSGNFRIGLPTGTYSVFTREEGGYFANIFENGNINPVKVSENNYSRLNIEINYKAVY